MARQSTSIGRKSSCNDRWSRYVSFLTKLPIDRYDPDAFKQRTSRLIYTELSAVLSAAAQIKLAASLLTWMNIANMHTDPEGILIELLPPPLRDHMPDRYIGACNG